MNSEQNEQSAEFESPVSKEGTHYEYVNVDPSEESDAGIYPVLIPNGWRVVPDAEANKRLHHELVLETLERARNTAMQYALKARVPECGEFSAIAQDLDWSINILRKSSVTSQQRDAVIEGMTNGQ